MKEYETIHLEKKTKTRKRLKTWCARRELNFTEGIEELMRKYK